MEISPTAPPPSDAMEDDLTRESFAPDGELLHVCLIPREGRVEQTEMTDMRPTDDSRVSRRQIEEEATNRFFNFHCDQEPSPDRATDPEIIMWTNGCVIATVSVFLLTMMTFYNYWRFPWALPINMAFQMFLHIFGFRFSRHFCNIACYVSLIEDRIEIYCSLFKWLLTLSFWFGTVISIIILAPIWSTWRMFVVCSPLSGVIPSKLDSMTTNVQDIPAFSFSPSSFINMSGVEVFHIFHHEDNHPSSALDKPLVHMSDRPTGYEYVRRLWPMMYWMIRRDGVAAVAPVVTPEGKHYADADPSISVWAVCSDGPSLGCDCRGSSLEPINDPSRLVSKELTGWQVSPGLASHTSITHALHQSTARDASQLNVFVCFKDPNTQMQHLTMDVTISAYFAIFPLCLAALVGLRLMIYFLCELRLAPSTTLIGAE